jgi:hypothetical protein
MSHTFEQWKYVECVSPDGQEWLGCGVAPIDGTEFVWLESSAERAIPVARLIAAAPDLLEALKSVDLMFSEPGKWNKTTIAAAVRAAIAKAEGGAA